VFPKGRAVPLLKPVDERFFELAPARYSHCWSIRRPTSEVWDELVSDRPMHWCRGQTINWTSPRPFSVGTTREAKVLGSALKLRELFFLWEEGRRYAFYMTEANVPLFRSIAEDYIVEPDGPNRCTFRWTVALAPTAIGKPGGAVYGFLFNRFFKDTTRYFAAA
jgi:hypothetical protein